MVYCNLETTMTLQVPDPKELQGLSLAIHNPRSSRFAVKDDDVKMLIVGCSTKYERADC